MATTYTGRLQAVSSIPGASENSTYTGGTNVASWLRAGDEYNSAIPYFTPDANIDFDTTFLGQTFNLLRIRSTKLYDNWLTGDMVDAGQHSTSGGSTTGLSSKYEERPTYTGRAYRLLNTMTVSAVATDSTTIDASASRVSSFSGSSQSSTLEGESTNNLKQAITTDTGNGTAVTGGYRKRYFNTSKVRLNNGVEAFRVSTIFGGYTRVAQQVLNIIGSKGMYNFLRDVLGWRFSGLNGTVTASSLLSTADSVFCAPLLAALFKVPNIYTFIDFFVDARGNQYGRVWDTSRFPQHHFHLKKGERRAYTSLPWTRNQAFNSPFVFFNLEAGLRITPYYMPQSAYLLRIRNQLAGGAPPYANQIQSRANDLAAILPGVSSAGNYLTTQPKTPERVFGETAGGVEISSSTVSSRLPNNVLDPFVNERTHG